LSLCGANSQEVVDPRAPARALLKIASRNPHAVLDALHPYPL
jgi:hypothetical protein